MKWRRRRLRRKLPLPLRRRQLALGRFALVPRASA
jgi:hypothetical protein